MKETGVSHDQYSDAHDFFKILHNHKFERTFSILITILSCRITLSYSLLSTDILFLVIALL